MKLSIVGTGYVGLVSGACLADRGHQVVCVDVDAAKVDSINSGRAPIHEPGLPELLQANIGRRLRATRDLRAAVLESEMTMIAVGTPAVEGRISLEFVERAAGEIGTALRDKHDHHAVVVKSTVIPGTTDGAVRRAIEAASGKAAGAGFALGMNPEFLTEGTAVADFMRPDRLVLGGIDARTQDALATLYAAFDTGVPRIRCNNATAEMIKYASNSVLATLISFSNEIARLCAAVGNVDVADVMRGVHASTYLTTRRDGASPLRAGIASFLEAGCGFGGSCLPKDVTALTAQGRDLGLEMPLLRSVLDINRTQPAELIRLVTRHFPDLRGRRVTVLGLAFKPDTDDVRESPAFPVLRMLRERGAHLTAYDPVARPAEHEAMQGVTLAGSLEEAVTEADVIVLVTRWKEFERLAAVLKAVGRSPLVVDGRRVLPPEAFANYEGIGREGMRT